MDDLRAWVRLQQMYMEAQAVLTFKAKNTSSVYIIYWHIPALVDAENTLFWHHAQC